MSYGWRQTRARLDTFEPDLILADAVDEQQPALDLMRSLRLRIDRLPLR